MRRPLRTWCRAENAPASSRSSRFSRCRGVLEEAGWPWELLDVEPLFDGHATVLHYLGPLQPDVASVRARFRIACDFDIVLEPVGSDAASDESEALEPGTRMRRRLRIGRLRQWRRLRRGVSSSSRIR